jgi:hypothetical protein
MKRARRRHLKAILHLGEERLVVGDAERLQFRLERRQPVGEILHHRQLPRSEDRAAGRVERRHIGELFPVGLAEDAQLVARVDDLVAACEVCRHALLDEELVLHLGEPLHQRAHLRALLAPRGEHVLHVGVPGGGLLVVHAQHRHVVEPVPPFPPRREDDVVVEVPRGREPIHVQPPAADVERQKRRHAVVEGDPVRVLWLVADRLSGGQLRLEEGAVLVKPVVQVRAARVLVQVVIHDGVNPRHDGRVRELDEEVIQQRLAPVRDAQVVVVAHVDERRHLEVWLHGLHFVVRDVHLFDEGRRVRPEEFPEGQHRHVEAVSVEQKVQAAPHFRQRVHWPVVDEVEGVLQVGPAEQLNLHARRHPVGVRVAGDGAGVRPPRIGDGVVLLHVVERRPLDVVAAILDVEVDGAPGALQACLAGKPEVVQRLDGVQRVEVQPAAFLHLRRMLDAQRLGGGGLRTRRHHRLPRVKEAVAQQLERVPQPILHAQLLAAGHEQPRAFAVDAEAVGAIVARGERHHRAAASLPFGGCGSDPEHHLS